MKKIILSIIVTIFAMTCRAAEDVIIVYLTAGRTVIIPFNETQEITFTGSSVSFGTKSYPVNEVTRYEFADSSEAGIEDVEGAINGLVIDPAGHIDYSAIENQTGDIAVYGINGISLPFKQKDKTIDISDLPAGVYIVKLGTISFKMQKR